MIDFLYVFNFIPEKIENAIQRLNCSLESVKNQSINITIGNYSFKCIKENIINVNNLIYYWKPVEGIYNKCKMINYGVKNYIKGEYFLFSDIDLIYPSNYVEFMNNKINSNGKPVRVVPFNYNMIDRTYTSDYNKLKNLHHTTIGGFAHGNGLFHLQSFLDIRGYNEKFIGYNPEDADYNERLSIINNIIYVREIATYHLYHVISNRTHHAEGIQIYKSRQQEYEKIGKNNLRLEHAIVNDENWGNL